MFDDEGFDLEDGDERGCGVREPGGIYAEVPLGRGGQPIEVFLLDPPMPLGDLMIAPRGVQIVERPNRPGTFDIYDWVGESGYPNVADMIEEIKRMGLSRRLGKSLDFSKLGPGSLIFLVHPRAIISNRDDLYDLMATEEAESPEHAHPFCCPCDRKEHAELPGGDNTRAICAALWWECLSKAEPIYDLAAPRRSCTRTVGSTTYRGYHLPHGFNAEYEPGVFARFPITRLAVVADPEGGQDAVAHKRLESCRLPVRDTDM